MSTQPAAAPGAPAEVPPQRLEHFPISFFAIVMGLMGLTLALHATETRFQAGSVASEAMLAFASAVLATIAVVYLLKTMRYRHAVVGEWRHPVRIAFFPAMSISLLLLATALMAPLPDLAHVFWLVGATAQAVLTLSVIANWIGHRPFQPVHLSPAWFIPAVGNIIVPVAGVRLGYVEISWLFFSAGLMFWIVLLTLVMNRLIFHDPLPGRLVPTLVILIAPPAVAFLAWLQLNGGVLDPLARILINAAYVFAALVVTQLGKFRTIPFALSWWALTFPVAALALASYRFGALANSAFHANLGTALTALLAVIVVYLVVRTLKAMRAGEVCVPE